MPRVWVVFFLTTFLISKPFFYEGCVALAQEPDEIEILAHLRQIEDRMRQIRLQDQKILDGEEQVLNALIDLHTWVRRQTRSV